MYKPDVLVVSNHAATRDILITALATNGYGLRCVRTLNEALPFLEDAHYDFALIDAAVCGMPPAEFMQKMERQMAEATVVLLTDNADIAMDLDIAKYLIKPINTERLFKILKQERLA